MQQQSAFLVKDKMEIMSGRSEIWQSTLQKDGFIMGCATHYLIADGTRYIGVDGDTKENIIVDHFKQAVKLKYNQINAIYNKLADTLLKDGEWKIISTIEVKNDLSEATIEIDVDEMMESLEMDFNLLVKRKKVLELELLEIEREITDLYHAMEFYNLDAAKGYKIYKMMQERLICRRKNKNETLKIDYILSGGIKGLTSKQTRKHFESLENRQYTPRALKELFEV